MAEQVKQRTITVTPTAFKVLNISAAALIIFTNILRFVVKPDDKEGIDGTPVMLFIVQTILTVLHAIFIICGELFWPLVILANYPLLVSRMGRGIIIVLVAVPLLSWNFFIIVLVLLIILIGLLNVFAGKNDPPVTLKMAKEGVPEQKDREVEIPNKLPTTGTSNAPALTGT